MWLASTAELLSYSLCGSHTWVAGVGRQGHERVAMPLAARRAGAALGQLGVQPEQAELGAAVVQRVALPAHDVLHKVRAGGLMEHAVQDAWPAAAGVAAACAAWQRGRERVQQPAGARAAHGAPLARHHQAALSLRPRQRIPAEARLSKLCVSTKAEGVLLRLVNSSKSRLARRSKLPNITKPARAAPMRGQVRRHVSEPLRLHELPCIEALCALCVAGMAAWTVPRLSSVRLALGAGRLANRLHLLRVMGMQASLTR